MSSDEPQPDAPEPGAPFPPDAIDPELIALRRKRAPISAVLSISVVVLCLVLVGRLWPDLRFSRQGPEPIRVAGAEQLLDGTHDNQFVEVDAVPDRTFVAHVSAGDHGVSGHRATPILGTDDRLWLLVDSNPWASTAVSETYRGRVRALARIPFAEPLTEYVAAQPPTPRHVTAQALRAAVESGTSSIAAPGGRAFPLTESTPVSVTERIEGRAQLWAAFSGRTYDVATWGKELVSAGVVETAPAPVRENRRGALFVVPTPDGTDALEARLTAARLYSVKVEPIDKIHRVAFGELEAKGGLLSIAGAAGVSWGQILGGTVAVRHRVPDDARILIAGEDPAGFWYVMPLVLVLAGFAALFVWALVRAARAWSAARPAAT